MCIETRHFGLSYFGADKERAVLMFDIETQQAEVIARDAVARLSSALSRESANQSESSLVTWGRVAPSLERVPLSVSGAVRPSLSLTPRSAHLIDCHRGLNDRLGTLLTCKRTCGEA